MAILLLGARELRLRMDALKGTFLPAGRRWAEDTVEIARPRVRVKSGRTRNSLRIRSATKNRATVAIRFTARFQESDSKAAHIKPKKKSALKFVAGGRTIFARKAERRAQRGRPFLAPSAKEALDRSPMREELVRAWNGAA